MDDDNDADCGSDDDDNGHGDEDSRDDGARGLDYGDNDDNDI